MLDGLGIEVLEGAGLDAAVLDEAVDLVLLEPDDAPESVGGNVTLIDGVPSVAVLRPSTGAVFVFDGWASEGEDVSVAPAHFVIGAIDVLARDRGDGCSTLLVVHDDGTEEEIIS